MDTVRVVVGVAAADALTVAAGVCVPLAVRENVGVPLAVRVSVGVPDAEAPRETDVVAVAEAAAVLDGDGDTYVHGQ